MRPSTVAILLLLLVTATQFATPIVAYQPMKRHSTIPSQNGLRSNHRIGPKQSSNTGVNTAANDSKRKYRNDGPVHAEESISTKPRSASSSSASSLSIIPKIKIPILSWKRKKRIPIQTVDELRHLILDLGMSLKDTQIIEKEELSATTTTTTTSIPTDFFDHHAVRQLILQRYQQQSLPGHRFSNDTSILALSIEGGGMRGCVSAGMVAAIAALGLTDTIDKVYGSSAGSVVGAYLISRQVCMDVYVDILPAAKELFVCKKRMFQGIASSLVDVLKNILWKDSTSTCQASSNTDAHSWSSAGAHSSSSQPANPGMNISFVLDGIMGSDHGIRPLDVETFRKNDAMQPLRVVSSAIDPETGRLYSQCFGTQHFFNSTAVEKLDGSRMGLFACLEASMTVPGATGPPVNLRQTGSNNTAQLCFDAFCFEPIPYRSAVEEGATHVLVLSSRPGDYQPKTQPGIYETGVAPLYFHSHDQPEVAEFFESGGQQYLYAEDLLVMEQAKSRKVFSADQERTQRVMIPPPEILYGVPQTRESRALASNRRIRWKRAHLMPIRVPKGHKELPTLEQNKDAVLEAVRGGFATAFDALSSIVGLDHIEGAEAAKLVFPQEEKSSGGRQILEHTMHVQGEAISPLASNETGSDLFGFSKGIRCGFEDHSSNSLLRVNEENVSHQSLLARLPGFQGGRFGHLSRGLRSGLVTSKLRV